MLVILVCAACAHQEPKLSKFVYTPRSMWEQNCLRHGVGNTVYLLGDDIVVCIGRGASRKTDTLYMTAAAGFSEQERAQMVPAEQREELPNRDDPVFDCLDATNQWRC